MEEKKTAKAGVLRAGRRTAPGQRRRCRTAYSREYSRRYCKKNGASVKSRYLVYQRNYRAVKRDKIVKARKESPRRKGEQTTEDTTTRIAKGMEENKVTKASVPRAGRGSASERRRRYYEQNIQRERQFSKAYRERNGDYYKA